MIIMGIDEAGRGPLIGPMILVGLRVDLKDIVFLEDLDIKDSKKLTKDKRERLLPHIVEIAKHIIVAKISPKDIDSGNLNEITYRAIGSIIESSCRTLGRCPDSIYIDSIGKPSTTRIKINDMIRGIGKNIELIIENKADEKYIVVGAASIVAKVLRDWEIDKISMHIGYFGSGYPSDPRTVEWLNNLDSKSLERARFFIRHKWSTYKRRSPHIISLDKYTFNGEALEQ